MHAKLKKYPLLLLIAWTLSCTHTLAGSIYSDNYLFLGKNDTEHMRIFSDKKQSRHLQKNNQLPFKNIHINSSLTNVTLNFYQHPYSTDIFLKSLTKKTKYRHATYLPTHYKTSNENLINNKKPPNLEPHIFNSTRKYPRDAPPPENTWSIHEPTIIYLIVLISIFFILSITWIAYMQRQITRRKIIEDTLCDQYAFMQTLVNATPHPIYVRDHQGILQTCNDSYLNTFSIQREDVIGKNIMQTQSFLNNEHEAQGYLADYMRVIRQGEPLILDRSLHIDDQILFIHHWMIPYRDSQGEVKGVIGGWIDISERHKLLHELLTAKKMAEATNQAKSTFLATMSHEIRTPMNAVIGMLELALKHADQGDLDRPSIEIAYNSANELLDLIGDILDIARIESGKFSLAPRRENPCNLAGSVVRIFDGLARKKNLHLLLTCQPKNPTTDFLIDPQRFKQILSNLISNAIKFTKQGKIQIELKLLPVENSTLTDVQISVQDTGIGISQHDQKKLFEPFAQIESSDQMPRCGAGLGLVICRSLCEMMGGTLMLDSEPGVGTQVHIALRVETLPPILQEAEQQSKITPTERILNVLVVDDHPANRLLLCQQLDFLGHSFTTAENGKTGLNIWKKGNFDLVITDCNMPVMNGYELTREIRKHERSQQQPNCTVLGFTANAQPEERIRCKKVGMDHCLFKPIGLSLLSKHLGNVAPLASDIY